MTLEELAEALRRIHLVIVEQVVSACGSADNLADVAHDGPGDTIYEIDRISEEALVALVCSEIAVHDAVELIETVLVNHQNSPSAATPRKKGTTS